MGHVHITNDRDHKVFVFIRDQLSDAARLVRENADEQGLLRFGDKYDTEGAKLTVRLRQYWPPLPGPEGTLVGSVDIFANEFVLDDPQPLNLHPDLEQSIKTAMAGPLVDGTHHWQRDPDAVPGRPTTHEDLLDIYKTRAEECGSGFILAGEIGEAGNVLVNREPALGQNKFKLKMGSALLPGYIELVWSSCELTRFGCGVTFYYNVNADRPTREAIEAAFIELLAGALPPGAS
jgi:hypothetical protein